MKRVNLIRTFANMTLLLILIISITPIHTYTCSHHSDSHRHECCSCESHIADCAQHGSEIEHRCSASDPYHTEYILPATKSTIRQNNIGEDIFDSHLLAITLTIATILTLIHLTRPKQDDSIIDGFDPACDSLRAPPALV